MQSSLPTRSSLDSFTAYPDSTKSTRHLGFRLRASPRYVQDPGWIRSTWMAGLALCTWASPSGAIAPSSVGPRAARRGPNAQVPKHVLTSFTARSQYSSKNLRLLRNSTWWAFPFFCCFFGRLMLDCIKTFLAAIIHDSSLQGGPLAIA